MRNSRFLVVLFFTSLLCYSGAAHGQVDFKAPLDPYFIPKAVKKGKIKSATIFLDMNRRDINSIGSVSGKSQEIEFNSQGLITYRLRSETRGAPPFIDYGRGSYFEMKTYDEKGHVLTDLKEAAGEIHEEISTYDKDGNRVSQIKVDKNDTLIIHNFEWSKGRMIQSKFREITKGEDDWRQEFDTKGRIALTIFNAIRITHEYEEMKDSLFTTITVYTGDKITSIEKSTSWNTYNRVTNWVKTNAAGEVEASMKVTYDKNGNATDYYYNEDSPISFRIENEYNARKLLVRRLVYATGKDNEINPLIRVERYVYEQTPLIYRLKKHDLYKN